MTRRAYLQSFVRLLAGYMTFRTTLFCWLFISVTSTASEEPLWWQRAPLSGQQEAFRRLQQESADKVLHALRKSKCPEGCNVHGVCNEELGRCDCPRQLDGPSCNVPVKNLANRCLTYGFTLTQCRSPSPCMNSCNGRGRCVAGVCHCIEGFFGMDCSLSLGPDGRAVLLAGHNYTMRKGGPKIYVYELPPNCTSWFNYQRIDRPMHLLFWQRLMSAGLRTADGDDADYYYIPLNSRCSWGTELYLWALDYVRKTWPWWDKYQGHRHILIHTGDLGYRELHRHVQEMTVNATWLTHWGLVRDHPIPRWQAAHVPGKDIVVPVMLSSQQGVQFSPLNPYTRNKRPRDGTFFFAGRICGDRKPPVNGTCAPGRSDYSAFVRQRVSQHHWSRPGFKVVPGSASYLRDISTHKYCLAPTGGGHGKRNILVALMGCIPVTITDHVLQPFEPELSWRTFSVPVEEKDIPRLHDVLESISEEQLQTMQAKLHCMAQHMFFSSNLGGVIGEDGRYDAFETIIEILRMRMRHPGLPPEQYIDKDERWRKFVNCELGASKPGEGILCSQNMHPHEPFPCKQCRMRYPKYYTGGGVFGSAGGAVCCYKRKISDCPKHWTD